MWQPSVDLRHAGEAQICTFILYQNSAVALRGLGGRGAWRISQRIPISPPLLSETKPLKSLKISGVFLFRDSNLGHF